MSGVRLLPSGKVVRWQVPARVGSGVFITEAEECFSLTERAANSSHRAQVQDVDHISEGGNAPQRFLVSADVSTAVFGFRRYVYSRHQFQHTNVFFAARRSSAVPGVHRSIFYRFVLFLQVLLLPFLRLPNVINLIFFFQRSFHYRYWFPQLPPLRLLVSATPPTTVVDFHNTLYYRCWVPQCPSLPFLIYVGAPSTLPQIRSLPFSISAGAPTPVLGFRRSQYHSFGFPQIVLLPFWVLAVPVCYRFLVAAVPSTAVLCFRWCIYNRFRSPHVPTLSFFFVFCSLQVVLLACLVPQELLLPILPPAGSLIFCFLVTANPSSTFFGSAVPYTSVLGVCSSLHCRSWLLAVPPVFPQTFLQPCLIPQAPPPPLLVSAIPYTFSLVFRGPI